MNRSTLPRARFARNAAEGGGGGQQGEGQQGEGQQSGEQQQSQVAAPVEATDEHGVGLGFPKDTPTDKMTAEQQAAYWRNQSKIQQKKVPPNLAELQEAAQKWAEYQRTQQSPADQQLQQVRDETAARVREEVGKESALALLRVSLHNRGKNQGEIDELIQYVDPSKFLTPEKGLDVGKATSYLDKVAPVGTTSTSTTYGQGRGFDQTHPDRFAAGKAEAERRGYGGLKKESTTSTTRV